MSHPLLQSVLNLNRDGQRNSLAVGIKPAVIRLFIIHIISVNYPNAIFSINQNGAAIFWAPFCTADRCQAVSRKRVCENTWLIMASKEVDFIYKNKTQLSNLALVRTPKFGFLRKIAETTPWLRRRLIIGDLTRFHWWWRLKHVDCACRKK